jgi:protein phosphatase PTC7
VDNARRVVEAEFAYRSLMGSSPFDRDLDPIHPLDVMVDAWNVTSSEQVMGSCTMCVATLDKKLNQLHYSNVGDGGLIVLRRMADTAEGTAGYSLNVNSDKKGSRRAQSPWKVAYLSQQQMKSFNLPYQLGNNPRVKNEKPTIERTDSSKLSPEEAKKQKEEEEFWMYSPRNFESPADADTASIPIMPGDLIILATDGLFDNMDLDDVVQVVTQWEAEHFPSAMGTVDPAVSAHDTIQLLAQKLVNVAREVSLDAQRDGPFALLAKENDILWSGGMPDDTTVVVARVIRDNSTS